MMTSKSEIKRLAVQNKTNETIEEIAVDFAKHIDNHGDGSCTIAFSTEGLKAFAQKWLELNGGNERHNV